MPPWKQCGTREGFADLYDNAKPWQRLMLRGANLAIWEKVLRTRQPPEPPVVFSTSTNGLHKMKMSGAVHTVTYRCGQELNGKRCDGLVGRGFKILDATPPTAVIVFKATVDRSTVLCSASIVIPARTQPASRPSTCTRHRGRRPQSGPKRGPGHAAVGTRI